MIHDRIKRSSVAIQGLTQPLWEPNVNGKRSCLADEKE